MTEQGTESTSSGDPLAEFRQKAGPIVAQARGLTPAARMKLADVARQLGIPEDQFESALRSLTTPAASASQSKSAEKFRRRLLKDLETRRGTILGPTHEARILAAAREKYDLDDDAALDVLASVTAELGIQRVRGDEATRNLADAIQDAIGDRTWIAEEARQRLHDAARHWGLGAETVDRYIDEQLDANRALAARSVRLSRAMYAAVGLLALFVVAALVALAFRPDKPQPETPTTAATDAPRPAETAGPPKWWSVDLALAVDRARKEVDGFPDLVPDLSSADEHRRAAAYGRMVGLVERVPPDAEHLKIVGELLEKAYAAEPSDRAAGAIREALLGHLPTPDSPLPKHTAAYDLAYWSAETAVAAAMHGQMAPERRSEIADALTLRTGVRLDPAASLDDRQHDVLAGLSRVVLRHLTSHAKSSPAGVAALFSAASEHAARHLERRELHRLQSQLLLASLGTDAESSAPGSGAEAFRPLLTELAASTDPQVTIALVDLYERMPPSPLRDELQSLLLLRLNVTSVPQNPRAIARALRRALGVAPTGSQAVEQRWEILRSRASEALEREPTAADGTVRQLTDAAELAWLATQALALAQGEAGAAIYDELAALYPEEPFALKTADDDTPLLSPTTTAAALTASEQQALNRFFGLLADRNSNQVQRESALRGLVQLAPKLSDLQLIPARQLAGYLLHNKAENEHAEAVSAAGTLRRWKQLRLAVADLLESATAPAEQQAAMVEALAGTAVGDASPAGWREALLLSVIRELPATASTTSLPDDQRQALDAAAESLLTTYRIRARLLGVSPAEYQAGVSPSQVLHLCAQRMIAEVSAASPARQSAAATADFTGWPIELVDRWPKELAVVDYLATDDLARSVLLGELMLKLSADSLSSERPAQTQASLELLRDARGRQKTAKSAPEQLRQSEADLLRLWLLLAPEAN